MPLAESSLRRHNWPSTRTSPQLPTSNQPSRSTRPRLQERHRCNLQRFRTSTPPYETVSHSRMYCCIVPTPMLATYNCWLNSKFRSPLAACPGSRSSGPRNIFPSESASPRRTSCCKCSTPATATCMSIPHSKTVLCWVRGSHTRGRRRSRKRPLGFVLQPHMSCCKWTNSPTSNRNRSCHGNLAARLVHAPSRRNRCWSRRCKLQPGPSGRLRSSRCTPTTARFATRIPSHSDTPRR